MKKIFLMFFLILLILIVSCAKKIETTPETTQTKTLSELQIEACNAADNGGTCDSRLAEIGIVLKEDCCEVLRKCC